MRKRMGEETKLTTIIETKVTTIKKLATTSVTKLFCILGGGGVILGKKNARTV